MSPPAARAVVQLALAEHLDRLWDSARAICLTIPMTREEMHEAVLETVRQNELRDGYIRLIVSRGKGDLGLDPRKSPRATWGKFTSRMAGVTFTSAVMCLRVDGNRAVVGAVIRQSPERPDLDGSRVFVAVEDNGGRFGVTPDRVSAYLSSSPPDTDTCDTATVLYDSLAPVTSPGRASGSTQG